MKRGWEVEVELEVPFHDVDALLVVWHGHYYKYLEIARTELLRACRLDIPDVAELDYRMLVVDSRCRYLWPLRYGDKFRVSARIADVEHRIAVEYEIHNLTANRCSARASTMLITTEANGALCLETPESVLERLNTRPALQGRVELSGG